MSETSSAYVEFFDLTRRIMRARGSLSTAVETINQTPAFGRVGEVLKSAVVAGGTNDPAWAANLYTYASMSASVVESLRTLGVFDRMLSDGMRRVPLRTRIAVVTAGATGVLLDEGTPVMLSKLALEAQVLEPLKALVLLVVNADLIYNTSGAASQLFANELKQALVVVTDRTFLAGVSVGAPEVASVGSTAADVLIDIGHLIDLVGPRSTSRLFLAMDATTASHLSTKTGTDGRQAFQDMSPNGGSIAGIPALVTDSMEIDSSGAKMILLDADRIAGDSDIMTIDASDQTSIQMLDNPTNNSMDATATTMVSMFQTDSVALRMRRWFGFEKLRDNAAAVLSQVSY